MSSQPELNDDFDLASPIEDAVAKFTAAGLRLPPIPRELEAGFLQPDEWVFGTEDRPLTDRGRWYELAKRIDAPASVLFGHAGHGANSYYLYYQLILGPLAVFVRQSYGGAYGDQEAEAARFNDAIVRLEELIVHADAARTAGRVKPNTRLIIAVDDAGASGWELAPTGVWRDNDNPIDLVIKAIGPK